MPENGTGHGTEHGYGHESRDASVRVIAISGAVLAVFLVVTVVLLKGYLGVLWGDGDSADSRADRPEAARAEQTATAPALTKTPDMGLAELRAAEDSLLKSYGWVHPDSGLARIPIDRAIAILAERGFSPRMGTGAVENTAPETGESHSPPSNDGGTP